MKIAYLILAHVDPGNLKRMVNRLYIPDVTDFFIHVDKKSDIRPFKDGLENKNYIHFISQRLSIYWGGYSICEAELLLMKTAVMSSLQFERFFLLSGQDYPLYSNEEIVNTLKNNSEVEYMQAYNLSTIDFPTKIPDRIEVYHFRDLPIKGKIMRHYIVGGLMRLMKLVPFKKSRYIEYKGNRLPIYGGSQWWILTRACVEYIVRMMDETDVFRRYFKTSFAPDELLLQTIVFNSPFAKRAMSYRCLGEYPGLEKITFTHYIEYRDGIKIFIEEDFDKLMNSGKMFCRKVYTGISDSLLNKIDDLNG